MPPGSGVEAEPPLDLRDILSVRAAQLAVILGLSTFLSVWVGPAAGQDLAAVATGSRVNVAPARVYVVWPAGCYLDAFVQGLRGGQSERNAERTALDADRAKGHSFILVGTQTIDTAPRAGRDSWHDVPSRLVDAVLAHRVTCLVVGPDARLAHLSLQLAVKTGIAVILVDCPDRKALRIPIPGVRAVQSTKAGALTPSTADVLGREVQEILSTPGTSRGGRS